MSGKVARGPKHNIVLDNVRHGCEAPTFLDFDVGVSSPNLIGPSRQNLFNVRPGVLQRQTGQRGENCLINRQVLQNIIFTKGTVPILRQNKY